MDIGDMLPRDGIYVGTDCLEVVNSFIYLGSTVTCNEDAAAVPANFITIRRDNSIPEA